MSERDRKSPIMRRPWTVGGGGLLCHDKKKYLQGGARDGAVGRLRHCATSQKDAGSIPDGFIGIFH